MSWFCPTRGRPERLAELALSWEKCEPDTPLFLRLWEGDKRLDDYLKWEWPNTWEITVNKHETVIQAMNGFFDWRPNEAFYGLVTDDIILRTPGGLKELERVAGDWFVAFPNDLMWRHRLPGHPCCGGNLLRTLGYWFPREFEHNQADVAFLQVVENCGLLRYCPHVIFHHRHFLYYDDVPKDETYGLVYEEGINNLSDLKRIRASAGSEDPTVQLLDKWIRTKFQDDVNRVRRKLVSEFENWDEWKFEDEQRRELALEA